MRATTTPHPSTCQANADCAGYPLNQDRSVQPALVLCSTESSALYLLLASCNMAYNTPNMAANKNTSMKEIMIVTLLFVAYPYSPLT
jgi:hypothetical protein